MQHPHLSDGGPQDRVVRWLSSMRQARAGFISTVDTILALEALVRYSYNNNIRDLTNMQVLTSLDRTG